MKRFFTLFFILTIFALPNIVSAVAFTNGIYDVSTSTKRDGGIISISVSGKINEKIAEQMDGVFGDNMYIKYFLIEKNTSTSDASPFSNSNSIERKCSVEKTGSSLQKGDKFYCTTLDPLSLQNTLDYGWYVFSIVVDGKPVTGLADPKNAGATPITEENSVFIDKLPAINGTEDTVGEPTYTVSNGTITINGTFNQKVSDRLNSSNNPENYTVQYGKVYNSPLKNYPAVSLSQNKKLNITKSGSGYIFNTTFKVDETGEYVFAIQNSETTKRGKDFYTAFRWISPFVKFYAEINSVTTVQLISPIVPDESDPENPKVTVRVKVANTTENGNAFIQLGHVERVSGSFNGSCILDPDLKFESSIKKIGEDMFAEASFSGKNKLTPGIYCVGAKAGAMTDFTKFVGKNDLFSIGGEIIPDTLTIDPNANENGCVVPGGPDGSTTGYCLLAPLPGVGDETGYVDTRQGIEKYINSIIRLVLGLIGVLSVLMIVVGGIEYMSTVNIGEKEGAKHRITQALLGLAVALGSYAILNTINPDLVNITIHIPGSRTVEDTRYGDNEEDGTGVITPISEVPSNIKVPDGNAQDLAKKILANSNIVLTENVLQHNEPSSGPKQNIVDTSEGKPAWRSSWGDMGHTQVPLASRMLSGLLAIGENNVKVQVNTIAGGDHGSKSRHYAGIAFDIQSAPGEIARTKLILGICRVAGATETIGPCNNNVSLAVCKATGFETNSEHQNHIHCGWPRSDASSGVGSGTASGSTAGSCSAPESKDRNMCEGITKNCAKYAKRIDELVKDPFRARFMKLNMVEESRCKPDAVSPKTDSGYAYGIFQQQPDTAKDNVSGCGVSASQITPEWLKNEANVDKIICIQENLIKKLEAKCGQNVRNLGAGQHGIKWCEKSDFCDGDKSCVSGNSYVMKWECPWNNKEHTEYDRLAPARESSKQMQYCSENPGSWMK